MKDCLIPVAVLTALSLAAPARAEGLELTFGLGIRAETESNPGFDGQGRVNKGGLDLSFGLTSETALSKLSFGASGRLLATHGPGSPVSGLNSPSLTLNYSRANAGAQFTLDASATDTDLATNTDVTNFTTGGGTQRTAALSLGLDWGKDAPLGFGLSAGVTVNSYIDNADPANVDNRTTRIGGTARADLSPVLHLNLGATGSRFTQPGISRDTQGLSAGLTLDRPTGTLGARLTNDHTPEGDRTGLVFRHDITLTAGTLSYALGATRAASGKTYATGSLSYAKDLPNGNLTIGLDRAVTPSADTDLETVLSSANLSYRHAVSQTSSLAVALNWAEQAETGSAARSTNTSLSASWSQSLTADWALDLGYTHRMRDPAPDPNSDAVYFELRREFSVRP